MQVRRSERPRPPGSPAYTRAVGRRVGSEHPTVVEQQPELATRIETAAPTFAADPPAEPLPMLQAGERIAGRYVVTGLLGKGGFGEVYRVRDELLHGEERALKLHRLGASNKHALAALEGEFELLASLSHPNLASVHDFGHVSDLAAFFTETLVPGERLDRTGLRPDDPAAMPLFAQLCRALEYLHSRGILHRDLKPSNVLVDRASGTLTLLDFGVARMFGASETMRLIGTIGYMAPESIAGGPVDARADLYALGVTFYQLLAGHLPFRGGRELVLRGHVFVEPPPLDPERVRPEVAAVVRRLLRKEPGERYASAAELLDALARANGVEVHDAPRDELASYVLSARFVGRAEAVLDDLVRTATDPEPAGRVTLIMGEAGSGKSRLLRETRQRAQLAGRTWVEVPRGYLRAERPLLLDLARAVLAPAVVAQLDEDDRVSLARALPELRRRRERIADPLDPELEREARHRALSRAIALRFGWAPGVLAIEDLHWAPREALDGLGRVLGHARADARCAVVATSRPRPEVEAFAGRVGADVRACPPLGPEDSARLVESMFGQADLLSGTTLGEALRAHEHPALYVQESLRLALERGAIVRRDRRWMLDRDVPAAPLGEVLEARVGHLSPASRRLALAAAVLGGRGTGAEIAIVAGQPLRRSGEALRQLVRAGVLEGEREANGAVGYTMHDRFMEVVLETASAAERRSAHRRAGRMLRRVARADWRSLLPAVEHFAQAGEDEAAVALCERAASEALAHGHPAQALAAVEREIALRAERGPNAPVYLLLRRFDLALGSGYGDALADSLRELSAAAERATETERVAIELRHARALERHGDHGEARPRAAAALARARALGDRALEGALLVLAAELHDEGGDAQRSMESFAAAAEIAMELGSAGDEARARVGATLAALRLGDVRSAGAMARRALEILRDPKDALLRSEALRALGNVRRETGDIGGALRAYRKAVRAARDGGAVESEAKALNNLGTVAQWAGRVAEAEEALGRAIRLKRRIGARASALLSETNLASLLLCTGRIAEANARLEPMLHTDDVPAIVLTVARSNLGDLRAATGRLDEAVELYVRSWHQTRDNAVPQAATHALTGLVRALIMRDRDGDLDEARALLVPFEKLHAGGGLLESGRQFHTAAAMVADRGGQAERMLDHARAARASEEAQRMCFTDVFGTVLEARWIEALAHARVGRTKTAERKARRVQLLLDELVRALGGEGRGASFVEGLPLHRAIRRGDLDLPPGWTYRPEDVSSPTSRA